MRWVNFRKDLNSNFIQSLQGTYSAGNGTRGQKERVKRRQMTPGQGEGEPQTVKLRQVRMQRGWLSGRSMERLGIRAGAWRKWHFRGALLPRSSVTGKGKGESRPCGSVLPKNGQRWLKGGPARQLPRTPV